MMTEALAIPKVMSYFSARGWKVRTNVRLRGRVADLIAIKDGKISAVEIKASGNIHSGLEQALHLTKATNFSYLAIPAERADDAIIQTCKNLGVGLMTLNNTVVEL